VFQYDSDKICNIFIGQIYILWNKYTEAAFSVFSLQFDEGNKNAVENVVIFWIDSYSILSGSEFFFGL
jgi:hypothetical protein